LNNYFGRQFNSLNDLVVNPKNGELYFTDTLYGFLQDFRPPPGLRNQVYRYNFDTGAIRAVADDFTLPNGQSTPLPQVHSMLTSNRHHVLA
jgi:gluconolactonase